MPSFQDLKKIPVSRLSFEVKALYEKGLSNNRIADRLKIRYGRVLYELGKFGLRNNKEARGVRSVYTKNDYLKVLEYFKTHTAKETQKKFKDVKCESGLININFKSLLAYAQRPNSIFNHLYERKDYRRKDIWSKDDLLFLLQHTGFVSRLDIGLALGRGQEIVIKEKLKQLGVASKSLQGLTLSQYRKFFEKEPKRYVQTTAGPTTGPTFFKMIPWIYMKEDIKLLKGPVKTYFKAMLLFREFVYRDVGGIEKFLKEEK